jgi:arabinogalactan oligomer / maltooligosaccharide transport system permease protein
MATTETDRGDRPAVASGPAPEIPGLSTRRSSSATGMIIKIVLLGLVLALTVFGAIPLISDGRWLWLAILLVVTMIIFYVYLGPGVIPLKYLIPGTILLLAFVVYPVIGTVAVAFTNFGDGHRGTKEDAIEAIEGVSVQQVPGSTVYPLTVATEGDPATGEVVFLLVDPETEQPLLGTADGLEELDEGSVEISNGKIASAEGYTVLNIGQAGARSADIEALSVPTEDGAIRAQGLSQAFEGAPIQNYDASCDCITDANTGQVWTANDEEGLFVDENGDALAQGWRVNVGFENFASVLTNQTIRTSFITILIWNFVFAIGTVAITFALGLLVAIVLNNERLKGQRLLRSLLILPYALPAFAMYLVWRSMFNTDFGLINNLLGLEINWFGSPMTARIAILLIQLWLGYSYMFLVCTGALQAIPADLKEAAQVDGARPFHAFRTITFPLLLVALAPLLIASFAFNFNNFQAIFLTTDGAPFPPDNPTAGSTDILITYTYRLAFGGAGAQYGFAAAVSIFIFLIVAVISIIGFRRTRALEEIN